MKKETLRDFKYTVCGLVLKREDEVDVKTVTDLYNRTRPILDRAQLDKQTTIITRGGVPIAAVVPVVENLKYEEPKEEPPPHDIYVSKGNCPSISEHGSWCNEKAGHSGDHNAKRILRPGTSSVRSDNPTRVYWKDDGKVYS